MSAVLFIRYLLVVLVGAVWLVLWRRRGSAERRRRNFAAFLGDENGASGSLDFAMTSIVYLPIVMCTVQFFLLLNAYQFVKYSSYYAARAAIVVIPESSGGERNELTSAKEEIIREAAAFAVSPVSPTTAKVGGADASGRNATYAEGIEVIAGPVLSRRVVGQYARSDMWWTKYGNALAQTDVRVLSGTSYGVFDPVVVEVVYEYHLNLPFANRLLRQGENALGGYAVLRSRCVMMNEGSGEKPSDF
ncbi:MAG: hypothetical protein AMXMBFR82_23660 [Candidatus Hydrogenedentota bacterium]